MSFPRFLKSAFALLFFVVWIICDRSQLHAAENNKKAKVDFNRQVRPILSDKCFRCHGPDESSREGDLRLDRREVALDAFSIDDPAESEFLRRILSDDPDERMPPEDSKITLSPGEIKILRQWINQGAPYQQHWSFKKIMSPSLPSVKNQAWVKNEIDRFILARLENAGLKPTSRASRRKLIRRLSFDLTGLPPSIEEIDAFLSDDSPNAYEKLVDRLLKSEQYGERMAVDWLDAARYSDSYGYQVDRDRFVWPWRDWVIKAFNDNLPYDQFITWQLAGDLLPRATDEQVLSTAFNRLHPQKVEGGSTPEEFRVEYVADRTHTFGTAFLGLTLECCRCHEHKYDPISQKEYYQFFAFFNSIDEAGLYSYFTPAVPTPTLRLTDEKTKEKIAQIHQRIAEAERDLQNIKKQRKDEFRKWSESRPQEANIPSQLAHLTFEDHKDGANKIVPGKVGKGVKLSGDDGIGLKVGNFKRFQPFSVSLWMNTPDVKDRAVVFHRSAAWTDAGSRGYQLLLEDGKLSASLIHFWPGNAIRVCTKKPIATGKWLHVTMSYDGSSRSDGLRIYVNGESAESDVVRDNLYKNITGGGGNNITIGQRMRDRGFTNGLVDEFRVFERQLTKLEILHLHDGKSLQEVLEKDLDELSAIQQQELSDYYFATVDSEFKKRLKALATAREERSKTVDDLKEVMVMRELPQPRPTYLLRRGAYDAPTDRVFPDTPAAFPPFPQDAPRNRLGLARWLTDPSHPLTARVAANSFWRICFGQDLVRTPEDFGSQGLAPTHPELLDWLARYLIETNWDVKQLIKLMVSSAAYQQDSIAASDLLKRDPDNLLLARSPSYRLPAEMIRDNALAGSGLLVKKIGGPHVKPYEVAVSFKPVKRDQGEGLYRRSLYTYWKRTAPAPVMMSLDASKRDVCSVKRERTSSPLQALVLLNDPQFIEASRVLGQRMLKKHGEDLNAMVEEMFGILTSRKPSLPERKILKSLYVEQLEGFEKDKQRVDRFLKIGDAPRDESIAASKIAAAAVLANAVMNLDECVSKK